MYGALIEVLRDLWAFLFLKTPGSETPKDIVLLPEKSTQQPQSPTVLPQQKAQKAGFSLENRICYVTQPQVRCLHSAHTSFDTLRGLLSYGDKVRVIQHKNGWAFVESASVQGWVESKFLTENTQSVFPQLHSGQVYGANNAETKKLRQYLNDELLGGVLQMVLQSSEFVMYRLSLSGTKVAWPLERPRVPGMWQSILVGKRGVFITPEPKTGSVLECKDKKEPFIAFVESVTPDDSIVISYVGRSESGMYEKKECTRTQWQQWRPVFISFT